MLSKQEIFKVAHLAQLELNENEAEQLSNQLTKALEHFQQIAKVNTEGVEPLGSPSHHEQFLRSDDVKKEITTDEILANAPERQGNLFKVPPVVGH